MKLSRAMLCLDCEKLTDLDHPHPLMERGQCSCGSKNLIPLAIWLGAVST